MIKKIASVTVILFFIALIIGALCWRAMLYVETTDEVYGIAQIIGVVQGQKPFFTSWCIQTGWCLVAPLFALFHSLNAGSWEGVVLFSRLSYVVFAGLVASYIAIKLLKKNKNFAYLAIIACISYVPHSVYQLGAYQLTPYLLFLVAYILDNLWQKNDKLYLWIIPGILMGIACINYATLPVMTIITAVFIVFSETGVKKALLFSIGVVIVAALFAIWILSEASIEQVFIGLDEILHSPHEAGKGPFWWFTIKVFVAPFMSLKRLCALLFFVGGSLFAQQNLRKSSECKLYSHFIVYVMFMTLNCILLLYRSINDIFSFAFWIFTISWILFDPNLKLKKYTVYLLFQLGFVITYALTSDNTNCILGFVASGMMTAFIAINALIDLTKNKPSVSIALIALLVFTGPGLLNVYRYVYRDEPVLLLNTKVERGIYKNLYTTSERRDFVLKMEDVISSNTTSSDHLCVATLEPMLYVMSQAKITTPVTWDPQWLGRKTKQGILTSAKPLLSYFEKLSIPYPNVIATTNTRLKDFYENDVYEIKHFLKVNYEPFLFKEIDGKMSDDLSVFNKNDSTKIALWRKKIVQ